MARPSIAFQSEQPFRGISSQFDMLVREGGIGPELGPPGSGRHPLRLGTALVPATVPVTHIGRRFFVRIQTGIPAIRVGVEDRVDRVRQIPRTDRIDSVVNISVLRVSEVASKTARAQCVANSFLRLGFLHAGRTNKNPAACDRSLLAEVRLKLPVPNGRKASGRNRQGTGPADRVHPVIVIIQGGGHDQLAEMALADGGPALIARPGERRQQQAGQNGNDGHHDKELDEGETLGDTSPWNGPQARRISGSHADNGRDGEQSRLPNEAHWRILTSGLAGAAPEALSRVWAGGTILRPEGAPDTATLNHPTFRAGRLSPWARVCRPVSPDFASRHPSGFLSLELRLFWSFEL